MRLAAAGLGLLVLLVLTSCTTGQGSGFAREASRERAAHNTDQGQPEEKKAPPPASPAPAPGYPAPNEPPPPPPPIITIVATPPQARITLNGRFLGTQSASFGSVGFGQRVTVRVEAPSYRPQSIDLNLWGQTETIDVDLVPIEGTLEITGDNLDRVSLTLDGQILKAGRNQVLVGDRSFRAAQFGYRDEARRVTIREDETTSVSVNLEPAPFDLTDLRADRPEINPESAAIAATMGLAFRATAPGHASLVLTDALGTERRRWDYSRLSTWDQGARWEGRGASGEALSDGPYNLTLTGGSEDGVDTVRRSLTVRIDRTLVDKDRTSLGPAAGMLWVPTPELISPGTLQLSLLGLGHAEAGLVHVPLSTSARFSPGRDWEVFGQTSFRLWSDPTLDSVYATAAVKQRLFTGNPGFRAAWVLGGTVGSWLQGDPGVPPTDFLTTFPGVRGSLPVSWSWGRWTLMAAPEVDLSYWSPSSGYEAAPSADEGLRFWAYGRAGLMFDPGPFSVGISASALTRTFDRGAGFLAPAHLGLEARWPIPDTPATLTGYLSVSAYSTVDYAWYGGWGLSFLLPPQMTLAMVSQGPNSP